jgi:hypothetical protein
VVGFGSAISENVRQRSYDCKPGRFNLVINEASQLNGKTNTFERTYALAA